MRKKILIALLTLSLISCSQHGAENLKVIIDYETKSENYIWWTTEQQITWDLFKGDVGEQGSYYHYFGLYFFYDLRDEVKFNATLYFDKEKSWAKPKEEWGQSAKLYDKVPKLLKLKFDYYEYTIRKLRKFLIDNKGTLTVTDEGRIRELGEVYFNIAKAGWTEIQNDLHHDFSDMKLNAVRQSIDSKLEELKEFDTRTNSMF